MLTLCPRNVPRYRQGCLHFLLLSSQIHEGRRRSFLSLTGCLSNRPSLEHRESFWESHELVSKASQLSPHSPSATAKGPGTQTVSVYFTVHLYNLGLKAPTDPQSFKEGNCCLPRGFCGFRQQKYKSRFSNTVCHTVFLHVPICNITAPKSYLLLHVCNQFVSRSSNSIRSGCLESKNKHISQSHCNISSSMLFDQCPQAFFHPPDCFGSTTIGASLHILR